MDISVCNQQSRLPVDEDLLAKAAAGILADAGYTRGALSIAVVDDQTIHALNRQHLEHDYPTDVLSFALEDEDDLLEGEVIVSADTAITNAADYGWPASSELLLYVIHGALHLVGYGDKTDHDRQEMRNAEAEHLARHGVALPATSSTCSQGAPER